MKSKLQFEIWAFFSWSIYQYRAYSKPQNKSQFEKNKIIQSIFSTPSRMELEINNKGTWKIPNSIQQYPSKCPMGSKMKSQGIIRKSFELSENGSTTYQNLCFKEKQCPEGNLKH